MKIQILTENVAGGKFLAEHGLSYLIEVDNEKILFDSGHSDVFIKNAKLLGIDLQKEISRVVLSHGHWDHGDGLKYIEDKELITHPSAFIGRFRKNDKVNIGLELSKNDIQNRFNLKLSSKPVKLNNSVYYLGEIPRQNSFESQSTRFVDESGESDFVPDDSALAIVIEDELIIVTGCSHSGICNITEYAKKVTGINRVRTIIGGFHLKYNNTQLSSTIHYLKQLKVQKIYPSHCTDLPALSSLHAEFGFSQVKTGLILSFGNGML